MGENAGDVLKMLTTMAGLLGGIVVLSGSDSRPMIERRHRTMERESLIERLQRIRGELRHWEDQLGGARKAIVLGAGDGDLEQKRLKTCADHIDVLERKIEALEQLLRGH